MRKKINNIMDEAPQPDKSKKRSKKTKNTVSADQLESLLREALKGYSDDKMRTTADEMEAMLATLEEFLKTFVLIGYSIDGAPVCIINAQTQQDADSLSTAVTRFFMTRCNGGQDL